MDDPHRDESLPPCVVNCAVYDRAGHRRDISLDAISDELAIDDGRFIWVGLYEPEDALLDKLQEEFGLHDLAVEDAQNAHQRPKLESYGSSLFLVLHTAQLKDEHVRFGETHIFVGRGYVVSVRHGASTSYAAVRQRCESCPAVLSHGEDYILYALLDFIVDNYMPVLEMIHAEVEAMEDKVFANQLDQSEVQRLYMLRRDLLRLRNAAVPLVDVCRRLQHADVRAIEPSMQPLFRDVTDHVRRVQEEIDALREVLAFAFEASLMTGQAQQTHITRRLAAWAAILAVPTAVAGIYGMNFAGMPELNWEYGYAFALGIIAVICITLFLRLKRSGWL